MTSAKVYSRMSERKCRGKRIQHDQTFACLSLQVSLKAPRFNYLVHRVEIKWGTKTSFWTKAQEMVLSWQASKARDTLFFATSSFSFSFFFQDEFSIMCRAYRGTIRVFNNSCLRGVKIEGHTLLCGHQIDYLVYRLENSPDQPHFY